MTDWVAGLLMSGVVLGILAAASFWLAMLLVLTSSPLPCEENRQAELSISTGGRFETSLWHLNLTWPFVHARFYDTFCVISTPFAKYHIPYGDIRDVSDPDVFILLRLLSPGLQLQFQSSVTSELTTMTLWVYSPELVLAFLQTKCPPEVFAPLRTLR